MKDMTAVRDLYQQWVDELAELEPQLDRISTRIAQLRTLTATMAQLDELRQASEGTPSDAGNPAQAADEQARREEPDPLDAEFDAVIDVRDDANAPTGRVHERTVHDTISIGDTVEHEMSTADAIIDVLRDADRPMGPSEVLDEMSQRGTAPTDSADPLKLVNTHLGRMRRNPDQPVTRAGRGRYLFEHQRELQDDYARATSP